MAIRLRRPSVETLRALLEAGRSQQLTYEPVGVTAAVEAPSGYRMDRWSEVLGRGDAVFEQAREAIRTWQIQRGAGLLVVADGAPEVGSVVAMGAPLPLGHIDVVCRVVSIVDEPDCFGFTYGSLPVHPERGEESFVVRRDPDGEVTLTIVAVSRPRHPLARAFAPIARRMQHKATRQYFAAMRAAVRG